jgi:hypothetical protein
MGHVIPGAGEARVHRKGTEMGERGFSAWRRWTRDAA